MRANEGFPWHLAKHFHNSELKCAQYSQDQHDGVQLTIRVIGEPQEFYSY